ncbi:MAG: GIY-YIG nuclease family protein [Sphingomonadaceae bacterium]|nr:GIY-YIG nuclease family protein [Sphingomonadaceae bacterium]
MANLRTRQTYLGVTGDLPKRIWQHRNGVTESYSKEKGCAALVWFEAYDDLHEARRRELQMKKWKRDWKIELIERDNPQWNDLYETLL